MCELVMSTLSLMAAVCFFGVIVFHSNNERSFSCWLLWIRACICRPASFQASTVDFSRWYMLLKQTNGVASSDWLGQGSTIAKRVVPTSTIRFSQGIVGWLIHTASSAPGRGHV